MKKLYVLKQSKIHGKGLFAAANIKKGESIIEYKGKLRSHDEVDEEYGGKDTGHTFLFILNDLYVLDANYGGTVSKWMNTSCDPNCEAQTIEDENNDRTKDRIVIEAMRDIKKGEELTYDYGLVSDDNITPEEIKLWACRCGAENCKGNMLAITKKKKKSVTKKKNPKSKKKTSVKKKR
jgi:hypothetical protein